MEDISKLLHIWDNLHEINISLKNYRFIELLDHKTGANLALTFCKIIIKMEAYVLDISGRENGSLLQNKTFIPLDGPIFSVSSCTNNKTVSFVHAAWNKLGTEIVAGDCHGHIYIFYLQKNKFSRICRLKVCSSFLTFTNDKIQNILVALSDCNIVSVNSELKEVKNHFNHHTSCVSYISFNKTGDTVLSCCKDQAILWDLRTFHILRILTLKKDVDIIKVFFLQDKDIIVSAFNDDSVFLWNFKSFKCTNHFLCVREERYLNIKAIVASRDEKLLACAGRANWFLIWSLVEHKRLHIVSLSENVSNVKQITFLPNSNDSHILSILSSDGEIHVMNIKNMELLYKISGKNGKIGSFCNAINMFQLLAITSQGNMELYDIEEFVNYENRELKHVETRKIKSSLKDEKVLVTKKTKRQKQSSENMDKMQLHSVLKKFEEYPEKHRFFIWSQVLDLPHNIDAFKILHQESLKINSFVKDYSFMNPGIQNSFLRLMAMLACWNPLIQEVEYFQCVVFPFIKVLHKNTIMCFELLVTLISNWCQNWFIFSPFPPFHILSVIENILSSHDKELMVHFIKYRISSEVYAWPLLKSSFSEVFNKMQWLKLWDNIFSNPLFFQLYVVAAFNIVMRDVLLRCSSLKQFKDCYRKHGVSASVVLKKAYNLQQMSCNDIDSQTVIGTFAPVPKGAYPTFFQLSKMKIDFETLTRKKIIDREINFLKQREDYLDIKSNYLKELQELQILRRKLLLESTELKDVERLDSLERKLRSIQNLIQENLSNQVGMVKGTIGEDMFSRDKEPEKQHFEFQDYVTKIKTKDK
ncbi:TBC1 domain family member 31 [Nephila pilipes]|uniref:TBC1 domain family member 31 n=1 Tax=Nephila pilipes TaxID=299642 RepID=A0A8X6PIA4_NEPPI|nr:TBC1 domain family member 31 [Nephila pilipes]